MLNKIKSLNQELDDKTKRNIEILDNLKSFKEKKISLQNSIGEIHSSENFKKYVNLENKLNEFTNQKSKIKSEIDTQFTKISRPLGRYAYGSALDKDQTRILSTLVDDPFGALISANSDTIILILENIKKGVFSGESLTDLFNKEKIFPTTFSQLISVGEQTGSLDEMFGSIAIYYEEEFDVAVANLASLIEPIMIVFMGITIGCR